MQTLAAYAIFLLTITALGLGIIFCGVIGVALYQGASWLLTAYPLVARKGLAPGRGKSIVPMPSTIGTS